MARYFDLFPQILYSIDGISVQQIRDFTRRVSTTKFTNDDASLYSKYTIRDGETPEMVSDTFFGSCNLYWIILITNQIVDPRFDWCMSQEDLFSMCEIKYSEIYGIHHYEDANGYITDNIIGSHSVSNIDHEIKMNENKRDIKILIPELVKEFINEFKILVNT